MITEMDFTHSIPLPQKQGKNNKTQGGYHSIAVLISELVRVSEIPMTTNLDKWTLSVRTFHIPNAPKVTRIVLDKPDNFWDIWDVTFPSGDIIDYVSQNHVTRQQPAKPQKSTVNFLRFVLPNPRLAHQKTLSKSNTTKTQKATKNHQEW